MSLQEIRFVAGIKIDTKYIKFTIKYLVAKLKFASGSYETGTLKILVRFFIFGSGFLVLIPPLVTIVFH